jgi:filamentous hemagglutinin family protein
MMRVPRRWLAGIRFAPLALSASAVCTLGAPDVWKAAEAANPVLPQPCAPGGCGAAGPSSFNTAGVATAVATQNALKVTQTTSTAVLNWASFNIGAGNSVTFKQPSSSAVALNRIFQNGPAQIFGNLSANGQVYLINLNGFIFGPTANVNVGSLLVSSLPITLTDAEVSSGILSPIQDGNPILNATCGALCDPFAPNGRTVVLNNSNGTPVLDASGNPIPVQVLVQPGAQITAADQGRLLLAGQAVTNGGTLTAPDGQVILAAGAEVFLAASSDPTLRGLIVEVDQGGTPGNSAWNQLNAAVNQASGTLSAARGNITMVGLAVNQDGRISATTSVAANGSIRLEAAADTTVSGNGNTAVPESTEGGTLTIGPQSHMQILPELSSSATAVKEQPQYQSSVTLLGEQVILQGGSIIAPDGSLTAIAAANPSEAAANPKVGVANSDNPDARLRIDSGTEIDLQGSDATLPVTANLVSAQLRSSELADDPTQRNGPLHGLTVYVDARDPPPASLANVSGEIAAVPENVAQRTEQGGSAIFQSEGDIVFAKGASLNVSGGETTYTGGVFQTSYLVGANGQLYPIATANPLLTYVGVLNPTVTQTYNTWGVQSISPTPGLSSYQPGYVQGASAGSVQFAAPNMALQGTLLGSAVNGLYQRTPATSVPGATLVIGLPGGLGDSAANLQTDYLSPAVQFTTNPYPIAVADNAPLPGPSTLELPVSYLTSSGFTSTQIYSNYAVTLPANTPLVLPSGSALSVDAARIELASNITDPGGALSFQNVFTVYNSTPGFTPPLRSGVYVDAGVTLDVTGLWTNDQLSTLANPSATPTEQTWQNGGSINLGVQSADALLSLGNAVALHANGGAWLNSKGQLTAGTGGSITLSEDAQSTGGLDVGSNLSIDAFGVNGAAGGSFSLTAPRIEISNGSGGWTTAQQVDDGTTPGGVFQVHSDLFSGYGFEHVSLSASSLVAPAATTNNVLTVDPGTNIDAVVSTLLLEQNFSLQPSAATVGAFAAATTLAPYQRPAASVTLAALPSPLANVASPVIGDLAVDAGASITTDAGGSITLQSFDSILVDGTLRAPGGTVTLHILAPDEIPPSSTTPYTGSYERGFVPGQRIELGADGVIDVSGTLVSQPSSTGLDLGTLFAGGKIDFFADRGAVDTDPGSLISVAGVSAALDVAQPNGTYGHEIAASAGGAIVVQSGEAISLRGNIEAAAGTGGSSGPASAGSLSIALSRSDAWWGTPLTNAAAATFNASPLTVSLMETVPGNVPLSPANSNVAWLGAAQLAGSGLDSLTIEAGGVAQFSGDVSLALGRQFTVNAPVIAASPGANASVSAPYLQLGYTDFDLTNSNTATGGSGTLHFSGGEIELVGTTFFQGTSQVQLVSSGDLQLIGGTLGTPNSLVGGVTAAGGLTLDAERIYPATATTFSIDAVEDPSTGIPGTVTIGQTGTNPGTPLSAGAALSISAYSIDSTGTLYAPFGSISLSATHGITLGDGSLTSVSGGGLMIPYGQTELGAQEWIYGLLGSTQTLSGIPTRSVSLSAPAVALTGQATIDLRGGGDLYAYEWVPGPGGSNDALAAYTPATATAAAVGIPGLYAILPSTRGQAAPQDPLYADPSLSPEETVYWSGGGGLAAGVYPLLPARYATEPGAFLVQIEPQFTSASPGTLGALADGTPVVAGFLSYGATGLHQSPGYEGFAIYPGSYAQQLAAYDISTASSFFSAAAASAGAPRPDLPADAGSLSIAATVGLDAAGHVLTQAASGGVGAAISVTGADLFVGAPTDPVPAGAISLSSSVLASWDPGSLLLGGTFTSETAITPASSSGSAASGAAPNMATSASVIDVLANTVTIGAGAPITAGQILLVANQSIEVESGATLQSTSAATGTSPTSSPPIQAVSLTNSGNTAAGFLAVSDLNWLVPVRGTSSSGAGTVSVDAGATIASRGSLSIDGVGGVSLNGTLTGVGAEWSLGSSSIDFVPTAAAGIQPGVLSISSALVTQLDAAGAVRLASTGPIDFQNPQGTALGVTAGGAPSLQSLTLSAASLEDSSGANITLGAHTLVLEDASSSANTAAIAGAANGPTLSLVGGVLDVGPGAIDVNGFGTTRALVTGAVIGQGTGTLAVGGDLAMTAAGITAAAGSETTISATGDLSVLPSAGGSLPSLLGGALTLTGANIDIGNESGGRVTVAAPSGLLTLTSSGDITLFGGSTVSAAGLAVSIGNQTVGTPGGVLTIGAGGNLVLASGSTLDVSGAGGEAAGAIALSSAGSASLGGSLQGAGPGPAGGGSLSLDAGSLAPGAGGANPLTTLAAALGAGGFTNTIDLRVNTGDLTLAAGSTLSANAITLTADSGQITIDGSIAAVAGALSGSAAVFGGNGVTLNGSVTASGNGSAGQGALIEIGSGQLASDALGAYDVYNGAAITLDAGSTLSTTGTVLLRAPALVSAGDVAINLGQGAALGQIVTAGQTIVEPVLPFNTAVDTADFSSATAPTAGDFANVYNKVATYMTTADPQIAARLGAGGAPLIIEAGVEIVAPAATDGSGNPVPFTLPALDLSPAGLNWRFGGAPVDLTVRSAGNLEVANTLSDGFGNNGTTLLPGSSSSFRLVAGADLSSADPLAVMSGGGGTLTIDAGQVVRTGTGTIDLIAAGDIVLSGAQSGAYTAGTPALTPVRVPGTGGELINYPDSGGNLIVSAGGDIYNSPQNGAAGSVSVWQLADFDPNKSSQTWGVYLNAYNWNFATLGGGDVRITAGGNVTNVSAAAADSLLPSGVYLRSGGLSMTAGGDIASPQVFVADGAGSLVAGGGVTAVLPSVDAGEPLVGGAFYLEASSIDVTSRLGIIVDGVYNPTALSPPVAPQLAFYTYGSGSSLSLEAIAGDVAFGISNGGAQTLLGTPAYDSAASENFKTNNVDGLSTLPASLSVLAPTGSLSFGGGLLNETLYPSARGQLDIVAAQDVNGNNVSADVANITMSDAPAGSYATVASPDGQIALGSLAAAFDGNIHTGDPNPAIVVAGGDINDLALSIPKAAQVIAGQDIVDLTYTGQNLSASDQTLIMAARDITYTSGYGANAISVGGPGELDLLAGRNVTFGFSQGVVTTGNLLNANLPSAQGADLTIATGLGTTPDIAGFLTAIVEPSPTYVSQLESYVAALEPSAPAPGSFNAAKAAFETLSLAQQKALVDDIFFNELSKSGLADNTVPGAGFTEGYAAIDALYPGSRSGSPGAINGGYAGQLSLDYSRIYTLSGGNIDIVVPGGSIDVGLANPPPGGPSRVASQLGIVTEGPGNVDIYSLGDVNVNSSRIFTLGGGNILIWSDLGSIDAGLGAKTAISAPPPTILISSTGAVTLDFSGAASGSGIRTIQTEPTTPPGDVDLIAPVGTVNAGDAGIGAAGNINIAARSVVGVTNISFGGTATGVPAIVSGLSASLSGASSAAAGATNASTSQVESAANAAQESSTSLAQTALSWLDVFVTGLGEENCKPDDIECLKRQKTPAR